MRNRPSHPNRFAPRFPQPFLAAPLRAGKHPPRYSSVGPATRSPSPQSNEHQSERTRQNPAHPGEGLPEAVAGALNIVA